MKSKHYSGYCKILAIKNLLNKERYEKKVIVLDEISLMAFLFCITYSRKLHTYLLFLKPNRYAAFETFRFSLCLAVCFSIYLVAYFSDAQSFGLPVCFFDSFAGCLPCFLSTLSVCFPVCQYLFVCLFVSLSNPCSAFVSVCFSVYPSRFLSFKDLLLNKIVLILVSNL